MHLQTFCLKWIDINLKPFKLLCPNKIHFNVNIENFKRETSVCI